MSAHYYTNTTIARVIHGAMRVLQEAQDDSQPSPPWHLLDPELRANAIAGVEAIRSGLTPQENHERWRTQLTSAGWKRGEVRSSKARTHPLLKPWSELTRAQQDRNRMFQHIVLALTLPANVTVTIQVPVPGAA